MITSEKRSKIKGVLPMNHEEWMALAKETITTSIQPGIKFEVKQLFPGHKWDALSKGDRISFGRYFANCVSDGRIKNVARCENGRTRHNRYIKQSGKNTI